MAVLTLSPYSGLDMSLGIMPRGAHLEVYQRGAFEHSFAYVDADYGDEAVDDFYGYNFGYDWYGDLIEGNITAQERWVDDVLLFSLDGINVSVPALLHYVDLDDVEGELAYIFRDDDLIDGSDEDDVLIGMGGDDLIFGYGGHDEVYGETGEDDLRGGSGDDALDGGDGDDDLQGNQGSDTLEGGYGDDWIAGGKGDDDLYGDAGQDLILGNFGDDLLVGGSGRDTLYGGQGFDSLVGGSGEDWLSGDRGADTLSGGFGADTFYTWAEAGLDRVLDFNPAEGDRVELEPGTAYAVTHVGADTVIWMSGGEMVLVGIALPAGGSGWII